MRKLLLAGAAIVAFHVPQANAQIIGPGTTVFDPTAVAQLLKSVGIETQQLTQLVQTYTQIVNIYQQALAIYNAVDQVVGVDKLAPELQQNWLTNPMQFSPDDTPSWIGGLNDPTSLVYGTKYLQQAVVGGDFSIYNDGPGIVTELQREIRALASIQAEANHGILSIENRIGNFAEVLFGELAGIETLQQTNSLSARMTYELNIASSQQVQAQHLMDAAHLQLAVNESRQRQWQYQDEANSIEATCAAVQQAGGTMKWAACNPANFGLHAD